MDRFSNLKHEYTFSSGNINVKTEGFAEDFSEIEHELIYKDSQLIISYSKYPNGYEVLFIHEAKKVRIRSNYPLVEVGPSQFEVQFD